MQEEIKRIRAVISKAGARVTGVKDLQGEGLRDRLLEIVSEEGLSMKMTDKKLKEIKEKKEWQREVAEPNVASSVRCQCLFLRHRKRKAGARGTDGNLIRA